MVIRNSAELKAAILLLEDKKEREEQVLRKNFNGFKESLKPMNLLKSTLNKVKTTPGITGSVINASVGWGVGFLSKRILLGKSPGFFRKIIGSALEAGVARLVAKKSDNIKSTGAKFLQRILGSRKKKQIVM